VCQCSSCKWQVSLQSCDVAASCVCHKIQAGGLVRSDGQVPGSAVRHICCSRYYIVTYNLPGCVSLGVEVVCMRSLLQHQLARGPDLLNP
jgi:hypothetical protein